MAAAVIIVRLTSMVLALSTFMPTCVRAQNGSDVRVSGSIGAFFDVYSMNSEGLNPVFARRPGSVFRFTADPTLYFSNEVSIPISISITSREAGTISPNVSQPSILQTLANPMNRFLISPRLGVVAFQVGSHVPQYGKLTVSDAQVFGTSIEIKPELFRLSASVGILQRAVQADTTLNTPGAYRRMLYAVRLASESDLNNFVGITIGRMNDEEGSVSYIEQTNNVRVPITDETGVVVRDSILAVSSQSSLLPRAQEAITAGINFRTELEKGLTIGGELAGVAFTRDKRAPMLIEPIPALEILMTTRSSTRNDFSATVDAAYSAPNWGVTGSALYVGPGFISITQPFFMSDRVDLTLSPRMGLFDQRLTANGTVGFRFSNITNTLNAPSQQLLISVNANGVISENISLGGGFTNFGFRSTQNEDTIRYEQVNQSFSLTSSGNFVTDSIRHLVFASVSFDSFKDLSVGSEAAGTSNSTQSVSLSYSLMPVVGVWSVRSTASYVQNTLSLGVAVIRSIQLGGSYRFLQGLVEPDASIVYSSNNIASQPHELQITFRGGIRSSITKALKASITVQHTRLSSASVTAGRQYSETLASAGIRWSF